MKKTLAFLAASLLCSSSFAWVSSTATTDKELKFPPNFTFQLQGRHSYAIGNDSGIVQDVAACYTITVCANAAPQYHRTAKICDKFTLQPGQATSGNKTSTISVNYPFLGWCDVNVSTELFGWQHNISTGAGKVKIWVS